MNTERPQNSKEWFDDISIDPYQEESAQEMTQEEPPTGEIPDTRFLNVLEKDRGETPDTGEDEFDVALRGAFGLDDDTPDADDDSGGDSDDDSGGDSDDENGADDDFDLDKAIEEDKEFYTRAERQAEEARGPQPEKLDAQEWKKSGEWINRNGRPKGRGSWLVKPPEPEEVPLLKRVRGRGRPKGTKNPKKPISANPTRKREKEAVLLMTAAGIPQVSQARLLKITPLTLRNRYRHELDTGKDHLTARVATSLVQKALEGSVPAQQFWLKSRAGWKEADKLEVSGPGGAPLISPIERSQRMLSIMLENPQLMQMLKEKRRLAEKTDDTIDITPTDEEEVDIFS